MKTYTQAELNEIIRNHKHWLREDADGWERMRADLYGADLYGADLTRADLYGAILTRADLTGAILTGADFDKNRWNECAAGIHFFINRQEAVNYNG